MKKHRIEELKETYEEEKDLKVRSMKIAKQKLNNKRIKIILKISIMVKITMIIKSLYRVHNK